MWMRKCVGIVVVLVILASVLPEAVLSFDPALKTTSKVMVLEFNPVLEGHGGVRLNQYMGWGNPMTLEAEYKADIVRASHGVAEYVVVERQVVDDIPIKVDGFDYSDATYLSCLANPATCHADTAQGVTADYLQILNSYDVCNKLNMDQIDELWLWGAPYFGYWESTMVGPGSFYLNSYPISGSGCQRQMVIMGFSYERGASEMMHNFVHRVESNGAKVFGVAIPSPDMVFNSANIFHQFVATHDLWSGEAGCGYVHRPPNSSIDYGYSEMTGVSSTCQDWVNYPNLTRAKLTVSCLDWGCTGEGFYDWWLGHLPYFLGKSNGHWNNWWWYVMDYQAAEYCYNLSGCLQGDVLPSIIPTPAATVIPTPGVGNLVVGFKLQAVEQNRAGVYTDAYFYRNGAWVRTMPLLVNGGGTNHVYTGRVDGLAAANYEVVVVGRGRLGKRLRQVSVFPGQDNFLVDEKVILLGGDAIPDNQVNDRDAWLTIKLYGLVGGDNGENDYNFDGKTNAMEFALIEENIRSGNTIGD
jgi:hypothetical protein